MEAADIASEIIAQSKDGHHVALAFPKNANTPMSQEVRRNNLLFTSTGESGKKFYHVVITWSDKTYEYKYSNVDGAIALLAVYDKHLSQGRFFALLVLYKKGDPNLVKLTSSYITLQKMSTQDDDSWEKSIKKKLRLLDVVGLVESE